MFAFESSYATFGSLCVCEVDVDFNLSMKFLSYFVGVVGRVFANGLGDRGSIAGRVILKT